MYITIAPEIIELDIMQTITILNNSYNMFDFLKMAKKICIFEGHDTLQITYDDDAIRFFFEDSDLWAEALEIFMTNAHTFNAHTIEYDSRFANDSSNELMTYPESLKLYVTCTYVGLPENPHFTIKVVVCSECLQPSELGDYLYNTETREQITVEEYIAKSQEGEIDDDVYFCKDCLYNHTERMKSVEDKCGRVLRLKKTLV